MMVGAIDRDRASELLSASGFDALVLAEPEAFRYAVGALAGSSSAFRRAGSQFAVVPRDASLPVAAVVCDVDAGRITSASPDVELRTHAGWVETVRLPQGGAAAPLADRIETFLADRDREPGYQRPATFDVAESARTLRTLLTDLGLGKGVLGFDLDFVPANDLPVLDSILTGHRIANGSPVLDRLRAIKSQDEIRRLRTGIEWSEAGLGKILSEGRVGVTQYDLIDLFREGVAGASKGARLRPTTIEYLSLGAYPKPAHEPAEAGDPMKVDVVCLVEGYGSDMCRNFVFGAASADQGWLHNVAVTAFEAGLAELRPGRTLGDVHKAASHALAASGLPSYRRGHFGHGVGQSVFSEQWPFIAHGSEVVLQPNMVLAFEIPLYVQGVASFNLEELFLITDAGAETMNTMPRSLNILEN